MDVFLDHRPLRPHPAAPPDAVPAVSCGISWRSRNEWAIDFIVGAPPAALRLPEPVSPGRRDGLWKTTCFELFLRRPEGQAYREFNFAPSGAWAAYAFDDYRQGGRDLDTAAPIVWTADRDQLRLAWRMRAAQLGLDPETADALSPQSVGPGPVRQYAATVTLSDPTSYEPGPWRANLTAVIEEAGGTISYWALAHPTETPDFHHPDGFVLALP